MSAIFRDAALDKLDDDEVISLGAYSPWSRHKMFGGTGDNYPKHSGLILDVKSGHLAPIGDFAKLIADMLGDDIVLCYVPSHDPGKVSSGIRKVATKVAELGRHVDGTGVLVRVEKIAKLTGGGDRSMDVHLRSIKLELPDVIRGRRVLVLDDVTTSGNSLRACRHLAIESGARRVKLLALGKTS